VFNIVITKMEVMVECLGIGTYAGAGVNGIIVSIAMRLMRQHIKK